MDPMGRDDLKTNDAGAAKSKNTKNKQPQLGSIAVPKTQPKRPKNPNMVMKSMGIPTYFREIGRLVRYYNLARC